VKNVIVTGATGFIGQRFIKQLLQAGHSVHALHNKPVTQLLFTETKPYPINWHQIDLFDQVRVDALVEKIKADTLVHFAWYAEAGKFWQSDLNLDWLAASSLLLKSFVRSGGRYFLGAGSCAEYDWSTPGVMQEESTAIIPATLYGTSKSAFSQIAQQYCKQSQVGFAWGRIFWLYGPGEDESRLVAYVIKNLLAGKEANLSAGAQKRDFMHVDDVSQAFAGIAEVEAQGFFNIGSGQAISVKSLCELIGEILDKKDLLKFASKESLNNEADCIYADISKLIASTNFQPRIDLQPGLKKTVDWWKNKKNASV